MYSFGRQVLKVQLHVACAAKEHGDQLLRAAVSAQVEVVRTSKMQRCLLPRRMTGMTARRTRLTMTWRSDTSGNSCLQTCNICRWLHPLQAALNAMLQPWIGRAHSMLYSNVATERG